MAAGSATTRSFATNIALRMGEAGRRGAISETLRSVLLEPPMHAFVAATLGYGSTHKEPFDQLEKGGTLLWPGQSEQVLRNDASGCVNVCVCVPV